MPQDNGPLYFIIVLYALLACVILYQVEMKWRIIASLKCKLGIHKRTVKVLKIVVHKYYCIYCKEPKKGSKLTIIEGGRKYLDIKYPW